MTIIPGRRPGDRRVRIARVRPEEIVLKPRRRLRRPVPAPFTVIGGFALLIAIGTALLVLPPMSRTGSWTHWIDALFTATSAVCVTGLVIVDTGTHWSPLGQAVIFALFELGGFGIATSSTLLLVLALGRRTGLRDRLLVQESTGAPMLGSVLDLVRRMAVFTIAAQLVGAVVLGLVRLGEIGDPLAAAAWGVFHAGSAFNNAGFDLTGGFRSLADYAEDPLVLGTVGVLVMLGGLGYAILADIAVRRRWGRLALETKIVMALTVILFVGGAAYIAVAEWDAPETLGALSAPSRLLNAAFLSTSARSSGFSAVDTAALQGHTLFFLVALMFIGGASGSTAGGIRVTTFGVLLVAILSAGRGVPSPEIFGRRIPHVVVYRALAVTVLSAAIVFLGALILELSTELGFVEQLFETVSAFGTVGLTMGVTPDLPDTAVLVLALVVFVGRLGPLVFVLALVARARPVAYHSATESLRIG